MVDTGSRRLRGAGVTQEVFSKAGVRRGQVRLIATACVLSGIALLGELLKGDARIVGEDLGSILYAVGLSGLVGFGTNWLAIRMLFHPRKPVLGVQGVVPKKRVEIADRASKLMEERLISGDRLQRFIMQSGGLDGAVDSLRQRLPEMLSGAEARETLLGAAHGVMQEAIDPLVARLKEIVKSQVAERMGPMAGAVAPMLDSMMGPVEERIKAYVEDPDNMRAILERAGGRLDEAGRKLADQLLESGAIEAKLGESLGDVLAGVQVADLLREEILKQDDAELEALVNDAASDQLVFLQVAGGGLGMLAGLALIWPWLLAPYAALIVIGWRLSRDADRAASGALMLEDSRDETQTS